MAEHINRPLTLELAFDGYIAVPKSENSMDGFYDGWGGYSARFSSTAEMKMEPRRHTASATSHSRDGHLLEQDPLLAQTTSAKCVQNDLPSCSALQNEVSGERGLQ